VRQHDEVDAFLRDAVTTSVVLAKWS
jgi:hypothetical protein